MFIAFILASSLIFQVTLGSLSRHGSVNEARKFTFVTTNLPDRYQWSHNYGYCGEVSMVMACLKYGQYFSQYDVRDIAVLDPINKQSGGHWYSIGQNDQLATQNMRLRGIEYADNHEVKKAATSEDYVAWMKAMTRRGYAVTICVYMNHYLFYLSTDPNAGYYEYDHIVSISKYESNYDDDQYHDDDIITMSDHGLWDPRTYPTQYYYSYVAKDWIATRQEANNPNGLLYTLPKTTPSIFNYGIAQTGIIDENNECVPVVLSTNVNNEDPQIGVLSEERPTPMEIILTVSVLGLDKDKSYVLYKYNDETKVPTKDFNALKANAVSSIPISGVDSFVITEKIMSNEKVIYRAVRQ